MEEQELMRLVKVAIREELPLIVDAVIARLDELKKNKEAEFWKGLSKEEYERLMGS